MPIDPYEGIFTQQEIDPYEGIFQDNREEERKRREQRIISRLQKAKQGDLEREQAQTFRQKAAQTIGENVPQFLTDPQTRFQRGLAGFTSGFTEQASGLPSAIPDINREGFDVSDIPRLGGQILGFSSNFVPLTRGVTAGLRGTGLLTRALAPQVTKDVLRKSGIATGAGLLGGLGQSGLRQVADQAGTSTEEAKKILLRGAEFGGGELLVGGVGKLGGFAKTAAQKVDDLLFPGSAKEIRRNMQREVLSQPPLTSRQTVGSIIPKSTEKVAPFPIDKRLPEGTGPTTFNQLIKNKGITKSAQVSDRIVREDAVQKSTIEEVYQGLLKSGVPEEEAALQSGKAFQTPDIAIQFLPPELQAARKAGKAITGVTTRNLSTLEKEQAARAMKATAQEAEKLVTEGKIPSNISPQAKAFMERIHRLRTDPNAAKVKPVKFEFPETKVVNENMNNPIPNNPIDEIDNLAKGVISDFDDSIVQKEKLIQERSKTFSQKLKTQFLDRTGNLRARLEEQGQTGKDVSSRLILTKGTQGRTEKKIADAFDDIYKGIAPDEKPKLDLLIQAKAQADLLTRKPEQIRPRTREGYLAVIEKLKRDDPQLFAKLDEHSEIFFEKMNQQLDDLLEEGMISKELHAVLRANKYERSQYIDHIDPDAYTTFVGGRKIIGRSGIQKLKEGSAGLLEGDSQILGREAIERAQGGILNNRANKELLKLADEIPDNGIVTRNTFRVINGKKVWDDIPKGFQKVEAWIDGEPIEMLMPTKFADEWITFDPQISKEVANKIGWLSGANILRFQATGGNPEFAITNMLRDAQLQFLATQDRSSFIPKMMLQLSADVKPVFMDAIKRKGKYYDMFVDEGGMMAFLTSQGRLGVSKSPTVKALSGLRDYMAYTGETSEILMRLALMRRNLLNQAKSVVGDRVDDATVFELARQGKIKPFEAVRAARDYMDFSQGGTVTKTLDTGIPYLNAAVVATRAIFRNAKQNPASFTWKLAQLATIAEGLHLANKSMNPEAYNAISDHEKSTGLVITTPHKEIDENGNTRHIYYKVPLDQQQGLWASMVRALHERIETGKIPSDDLLNSFINAIPATPSDAIVPTVEGMLAIIANKDFWLNEDIWKGPKIELDKETTGYESQFAQDVAKLFNDITPEGSGFKLSPARFDRALAKVFTSSNMWTTLAGHGYEKVLGTQDPIAKKNADIEFIRNTPFLRRMKRVTAPIPQVARDIREESTTEASTRLFLQRKNLDEVVNSYLLGEATKDDVRAYIKQQPAQDRKRLVERFKDHVAVKDIPERNMLISFKNISNPEARAKAFVTFLKQSSPEQQRRLIKGAKRVPGFFNKEQGRFNMEFIKLMKQEGLLK